LDFATDTTITISPDVVSRTVAGEVLILNLATGDYHGLDPIGSRIWDLIAERRAFGAIAEAIVAEYDVDPERAKSDLARLLGEMAHKGLVRIDDAAY
jgi:hypothetical protein